MRSKAYLKRIFSFLVLIVLMTGFAVPIVSMAAQQEQKVVRVGWFESSFCYYDTFGRRCGIDYEYQQKISAYTGWTYEYVEDSWPNLLQMLEKGEIDLLSDVSYKPERDEYMYFADLPMGTEAYYIYISGENREITADNLRSFTGKRIGVNRYSVQEDFLKDWAAKHGIDIQVVSLSVDENESMDMVTRGEIDGYATIFSFDLEKDVIPVCRIGGSDYFYAVNKRRPDLLDELNVALAGIQDEDPYFNQKISQGRLYNVRTNALLAPNQEDWIEAHGPIRVGYRENYLPFCGTDEETGELTGALKDFLAHAGNNLNSPNLQISTIPYESTEAALNALKAGEIDCVFPVYLSSYDADSMGIRLTDQAMKTEMNAIMRMSDRQELSSESNGRFAVNEGMMNIETFIMSRYPLAQRQAYPGLQACYEAVASGKEDCVLVSNYRIPSEEETLKKYKLFTVPTGESLPFCFAVNKADRDLYFLMNKMVLTTKSEEMDAALASYMRAGTRVSFFQFLKDNCLIVIAGIVVLFTVIIVLLVQKIKAERMANSQKQLLAEAAKIEELNQTISSLIDNIPGVNFTKDANTGEYLACNQAFANYVRKKDPSEVVGLTVSQIFDEENAKRFIEDDKMALSMDEPLIFYENIPDFDGNPLQVKCTRLKYTDAKGRLCLMGIFQDATDSFRITRDSLTDRESYEKARSTGAVFTHIAQALARGYIDLYYIDLNTEEFIEYRTDSTDGSLTELRRGWHFFEEWLDVAEQYVYPEDRDEVIKALDRKTLVASLDQNNTFMMTYRMISAGYRFGIHSTGKGNGGSAADTGSVSVGVDRGELESRYVSLKVTRMQDDDIFVILLNTDVDEQMKQRDAAKRSYEEQIAYDRISALAGEFLSIYVVVPETGRYREYNAGTGGDIFAMPGEGMNFFSDFREKTIKTVYPEDQNRVFTALTMENVMAEIENNGIFTLSYRLMMEEKPRYVQLKAAVVQEQEGRRIIVGVNDIDAQVRQEEDYSRRLAQARIEANIDALTGVKNRNAYRLYEERLNTQIKAGRVPDFAIVILDVNDLKKVNDTQGHKAGDKFIKDACSIICSTFTHSPVFRVGGDEFAVLIQGEDYNSLDRLIEQMNRHNEEAIESGGVTIAFGSSKYDGDARVTTVYERADQRMYENKSSLKERKRQRG